MFNRSNRTKRTAVIEDWPAFDAWLRKQPLVIAMGGGRPYGNPLPLNPKQSPKTKISEEDAELAAALKELA